MNKKLIRKMLTAAGGPIYWLRKRLYDNIEPFGYNDVGSRLINGIIFNKNEHSNFKGDYSDPERAPALYLTIDNIWGEYLHIPEKKRRYSNGKYKIKNNGNGTFSLPFESMEDIMQTVNSNYPLLWGLKGKALNSVVGEYDIYRGYDKNGDYLKYIDHWRINPYDVKEDKEYGLDNNSLLKWYFKGKDDASFGLGTPVEIQGKYYLDDVYNVKGKDRGGHYLPEIVVTGKKKQGGKMNTMKLFKKGGQIRKMQTASGGPLQLTPEELKYLEWSKMTPELKREYRTNRAKSHLLSGPNITNFWEAFQTYIGNRDPENPHLNTGNVPNPGMKNPKDIIRLFRATGTSGKFKPSLDGTQEFAGKWFTNDIRKPLRYASSTFKKAKISKESNPVELLVVEIPASEINRYKASELLKGRTDIEYEPTEDFLIPLDYPRLKYPIEGLTGNLLLDMHLKLPIEKQGGKMNILEFLKNGSGIHIKKKNRGKFTSYCGGKVTDECIRKAKASGNPTLVKRATFAANVRKWKHKEGGIIKAQEGTNLFEANKETIPLSLLKKFFKQVYQDELNKNKLISAITGNVINTSPIVAEHEAFKLASLKTAELNEQARRNKKISEAQKLAQQSADISGLIGDGLGIIADYFINKKSNKTSTGTSTSGTSSSGTSNYKVDSFWTTPSLSGGNQFKVDYTNLLFK